MKVKIITLNYSNVLERFDTSAFDDFIKDKEINEMRDHFFETNGNTHLLLIIFYSQLQASNLHQDKKLKNKEEYKKLLTDNDLTLFQTLKEWRNSLAKSKGIPPYIIFDNTHLAHIAHQRPQSKTGLLKIEGIGIKKGEQYWPLLEPLLKPVGEVKKMEDQHEAS